MNYVFCHPFTCIISGPTQSGKTTLVKQIIEQIDYLINPKPEFIYYCYSRYQDAYKQLEGPHVKFIEGLPSIDEFDEKVNNLVIFDDLMDQCERDKSVLNLFTVDSHHKNISTIFITQNLFSKGKYMRTISLNSHYLILFNNPRDLSQIYHLARQMYPTQSNFLIESYQDAVENKAFGYVFLDLKQNTPKELRVRTGILLHEEKIIYVPK